VIRCATPHISLITNKFIGEMGSPAAVTAGGEFVKRWTRVLVPVVAIGAAGASVMPASAATAISPPTIGPVGGFYTAGTAATFTFTENGVGTAVAYQYTLNDGATQTIAAPSGTASPAIVPSRQHNRLIAYAVAADGTVSGGTVDDFFARAATPTADKDLNGDGRPDLLTVGNTEGLAPGLWQATGRPATGGSAGAGNGPRHRHRRQRQWLQHCRKPGRLQQRAGDHRRFLRKRLPGRTGLLPLRLCWRQRGRRRGCSLGRPG
jgi:hypothetical protein